MSCLSNSEKLKPMELSPESESKYHINQEALDILNKTINYNGEKYKFGLHWKKPFGTEKKIILQLLASWKVIISNSITTFNWKSCMNKFSQQIFKIFMSSQWKCSSQNLRKLGFGRITRLLIQTSPEKCADKQIMRLSLRASLWNPVWPQDFTEQLVRNPFEVLWKPTCHSLQYYKPVPADSDKALGPICTTLSLAQGRDD